MLLWMDWFFCQICPLLDGTPVLELAERDLMDLKILPYTRSSAPNQFMINTKMKYLGEMMTSSYIPRSFERYMEYEGKLHRVEKTSGGNCSIICIKTKTRGSPPNAFPSGI